MELFLMFFLLLLVAFIMTRLTSGMKFGGGNVHVDVDGRDKSSNFVAGGETAEDVGVRVESVAAAPRNNIKLGDYYRSPPKDKYAVRTPREYSRYHYSRKSHLMTPAERVFYKRLERVFPENSYIFPQVRLDDLFREKDSDDWQNKFAKWHIDRRSVDYVICNNEFRVLLGIELDDSTHDTPERIERDREVQRIFRESDTRLMRLRNVSNISDTELKNSIREAFHAYNSGAPFVSG